MIHATVAFSMIEVSNFVAFMQTKVFVVL